MAKRVKRSAAAGEWMADAATVSASERLLAAFDRDFAAEAAADPAADGERAARHDNAQARAAAVIAERVALVREQMARLERRLVGYQEAADAPFGQPLWPFAGDLGYVTERLAEVLEFVESGKR